MNTQNLKLIRKEEIALLVFLSIFSLGLFVLRYIVSDTKIYLFLNWNLFLALVPLLISSFIVHTQIKNKLVLGLLFIAWILFFPNAPYILTDLFHLKERNSIPVWFDLLVILSYAWTGLIFGFVSLLQIEKYVEQFCSKKWVNLMLILFLFISSFGVYLGRFQRWNSWDVVSNPLNLLQDILYRFIYPFENPGTWGVTILMGILLNLMYFSLKMARRI